MNIISGGVDSFNAAIYGMPHQNNLAYFQNELQSLSAVKVITDMGKNFMEGARNTYNRFNDSEAMNLIRTVNRQIKTLFQPEVVRSLFEVVDFQTASNTMQRWVMANPMVRQMYYDQRCEGYSETYVDRDPGKIGEDHYDYRKVMDGVIQETDDSWEAKFYMEELRKGDQVLSTMEKFDILSSWKICEMFMRAGNEDPTSPYNAKL